MTLSRVRKLYVAGVVERGNSDVLIVLAEDEHPERRWHFPRGLAKPGELPEVAMRRVAQENLGLHVEIVVGQPPIAARIDAEEVEVRYFFCGIVKGEATPGSYAEVRWISKLHLREYEFDEPSQPVVDWLLDSA